MSASVQRKPQPSHTDHRDHPSSIPHAQLRMALGSILSPKRPSYSRSDSGTASPAPYSVPPAPAPTPISSPINRRRGSSHLRDEHQDDASDGDESEHLVPPAIFHSISDHDHDHDHEHDISHPPSGAGTPRAKFIETLQSKKAWEALIHGSFS